MSDVPPHVIAGADQELAAVEQLLDLLIRRWNFRQKYYDAAELDHVARISAFLVADVRTAAVPFGLLAALTVAISRLADG